MTGDTIAQAGPVATPGGEISDAGARIVGARVIVTCPGRNFVTLKIVTDQGVHGIGDATTTLRGIAKHGDTINSIDFLPSGAMTTVHENGLVHLWLWSSDPAINYRGHRALRERQKATADRIKAGRN